MELMTSLLEIEERKKGIAQKINVVPADAKYVFHFKREDVTR